MIAVAVGLLGGVLLLAFLFFGMKWLLFFVAVCVSIFALSLLGSKIDHIEKLAFCAFIPAASIRLDVHLVHERGFLGFPITLLDIVWASLMVLWYIRIASDDEKVEIPRDYSFLFLLVLLGGLVAGLRSASPATGLRMVLGLAQVYLLFLYLWNRRLTRSDYYLLFASICGTILIHSFIGFLQYATKSSLGLEFFGASDASFKEMTSGTTSISRVGSTIGHPNDFGVFMNSVLFAPLSIVLIRQRGWLRFGSSLVFLIGVTALILTKSRGAWISFVLGFVVLTLPLLKERMQSIRAALALLWILILLAGLVFALPVTRERLLADDHGAAISRVTMMATALNMIGDQPMMGVGYANYRLRFHQYDASPDGHTYKFFWPVHNAYLLIAAEYGLPVLFAFLGIMLLVVRDGYSLLRRDTDLFSRTLALAFFAGTVAKCSHWMVQPGNPLIDAYFWFILGAALSMKNLYDGERDRTEPSERLRENSGGGSRYVSIRAASSSLIAR